MGDLFLESFSPSHQSDIQKVFSRLLQFFYDDAFQKNLQDNVKVQKNMEELFQTFTFWHSIGIDSPWVHHFVRTLIFACLLVGGDLVHQYFSSSSERT